MDGWEAATESLTRRLGFPQDVWNIKKRKTSGIDWCDINGNELIKRIIPVDVMGQCCQVSTDADDKVSSSKKFEVYLALRYSGPDHKNSW